MCVKVCALKLISTLSSDLFMKLCYFRPHAIFLFQNSVSSTNLNLNLEDKKARPFIGVLIEEFQTGPM